MLSLKKFDLYRDSPAGFICLRHRTPEPERRGEKQQFTKLGGKYQHD
jgi:hypothetical protein